MFSRFLNRITGYSFLFVVALHWTAAVHSAPGNISDSPIFADSNVPPNVFFEVDDSGSMDWEVLTYPHWHYCAYDDNASGDTGNSDCGYFLENGLSSISTDTNDFNEWWNEVRYMFDDSDDLYQGDNDCDGVLQSCSDTIQIKDWRLYSAALNSLYYNSGVDYLPWQGGSFSNASFTNVRSDPQSGSDGYDLRRNLKNGISDGSDTGFIYVIWEDSHGYSGSRPNRGSNQDRTTGSNGIIDLWDNHTRYYVKESSIVEQQVSYTFNSGDLTENIVTTTHTGSDIVNGKTIAEVQQNIANWYQYYRRRSFVAKAAIGEVVTANPENRYGLNFINDSSFPYNSGTSSFVEVPTGRSGFSSDNSLLLGGLFNLDWPASGTPLRQGLERVGKYFDNNSLSKSNDPIQYECQQNFSVLLTDGYWNGSDPASAIGDADGDGYNRTVADVAKYYYDKDLSSKTDAVPENTFDPATHQHMVTFTVAFGVEGLLTDTDNNGWPEDPSDASVNLGESADWGDPSTADSPEKIDDLWHAAFNSKGEFVSASSPVEVSSALSAAIGSVGDRLGSVASVAFNTTSLSADSDIYLAQFNQLGNKWSGELTSYSLDEVTGDIVTTTQTNADGSTTQIPVENWNTADELDNEVSPVTSRVILTYDSTLDISGNIGNGIPFQWANLTTPQKNDLRVDPDGTLNIDDAKAQAKLNYLRGDRSNEVSKSGTYSFRERASLMGDIIHSDPYYVKTPKQSWPATLPFSSVSGASYVDYIIDQTSRNGVIYVGANDGMLHGFSETTGEEILAYIPSYLFSSASSSEGLHFLTDPDYEHRYFVDLAPTVSDVYIDKGDGIDRDGHDDNKDWHTVLIGGSRAGGRGIFALDITDPSSTSFNESNAANLVLWEFTGSDDADLGLTFSKPTISMMNNGRWAAIFGNGYNNKGDGSAKLFIVFLDGGVDGVWTDGSDIPDGSGGTIASDLDYIKIDTGVGSIVSNDCLNGSSDCNGLSTPHAVDLDGDYTIDRVYAGDIKGNLWAFDVSASNNIETDWKVAYEDSGTNAPKPLFIAGSNQPIMDKPITIKHQEVDDTSTNNPNLMVYFGTGQYLTANDVNTVPATQSFYGVWDNGNQEITPSNLVEQTFDTTTTFLDVDGNDVTSSIRAISDNTVNYSGSDKGWKINFNLSGYAGERVIVDPDLHDGLVFFNTWIPDTTACNSGGGGFLMSVEQLNGGAPETDNPAFDFNGDGIVDSSDLVKDSSDLTNTFAPVGEKFNLGLPASSSIISNNQYTPGSNSNSEIHKRTVRNSGGGGTPGSSLPLGRISWQELR